MRISLWPVVVVECVVLLGTWAYTAPAKGSDWLVGAAIVLFFTMFAFRARAKLTIWDPMAPLMILGGCLAARFFHRELTPATFLLDILELSCQFSILYFFARQHRQRDKNK